MTPETINAGKARYAALKAAGQTEGAFERLRDAAPRLPSTIDADRIRAHDVIPGGWYWHNIMRRHDVLRVANPGGNAGVALMMWACDDPSERLNPPDTIKVQWTTAIGRGRILLSDMGRIIASIVDGPDHMIDCVASGSTAASNAAAHGDGNLPSNAAHFLKAAAKYGLGKRDIGPSVTLFAPLETAADGTLSFDAAQERKGRYDLRAEFDVIVALSNAPHPLSGTAPSEQRPIEVTLWRGDPPGADDLCLTATQEARWAAANTAARWQDAPR